MTLVEITSQTWVITVVGWLIVFAALVLLIIIFNNVPRLFNIKLPKKPAKAEAGTEVAKKGNNYMSGDETAAGRRQVRSCHATPRRGRFTNVYDSSEPSFLFLL